MVFLQFLSNFNVFFIILYFFMIDKSILKKTRQIEDLFSGDWTGSADSRPFASLTTSGLFALRAHNPVAVRCKAYRIQNAKKHAVACFFAFLVAEMGFEPHDLRVMSPTSYRTALLRDIILVPETGIEPARDLSPTGF